MLEHDEILNALDQEAKKRREEVTAKATKPLPDFVKTIESTTVLYTVDPDILPFSLIEPVKLVELINRRFQLKFRPPSYDPKLFKNIGLDTNSMTEEGLLRFMLQGSSPQIAFQNGKYPTGPDSFVFIEELMFARENIAAKVKGITDVAQLVIAEAFAIFWEATGAANRWDKKETQENIELVSYQTVTNINLGTPAENLLNPGIKDFLDNQISEKKGLGASMLPFSAYDGFNPNPNALASWSFDRLVLNVHIFDPTCGRTKNAIIDLDTTKKGDHGKGILEFTSELPFDQHVSLAKQIRELLAAYTKKKTT